MLKKLSFIFLIPFVLASCSHYSNKVSPVPLPALESDHVNVDGVLLIARSYVDEDIAQKAFGFDIRGAGLLPVKVVIENQSNDSVQLLGKQTFLLDKKGQAWPLLTATQANNRITDQIQIVETALGTGTSTVLMGAAGAIAGLAIGVLTGDNLGEAAMKGAVLGGASGIIYGTASQHSKAGQSIAYDISKKSFNNQPIIAGALAHGYLFFPGLEEAESTQILRLSLMIKGRPQVVNISLPPIH
ncbi:MAG: hypothetical protein KAH08_00975 [Methylococcales bacterium]|nr:hypothetical protein [Methylococcales bacterium]